MFKKCKIITTSCERAVENGVVKIIDDSNFGKLFTAHREVIGNKIFDVGVSSSIYKDVYRPQHLYIVSEEAPKGDDWAHDVWYDVITKVKWIPKNPNRFKKVISSTNKELGLPRPSNKFLDKYCEAGGFDYVMVEYLDNFIGQLSNVFPVKIAPDNTITIRRFKDTWNREELLKLFDDYTEAIRYDFSHPIRQSILRKKEEWIKNNL